MRGEERKTSHQSTPGGISASRTHSQLSVLFGKLQKGLENIIYRSNIIFFLIGKRRQQTLGMVFNILVVEPGNVVEEKRDRKTIGISAGVFWQTERTWKGFPSILKYREKAGEDTIRTYDVRFEKKGGGRDIAVSLRVFRLGILERGGRDREPIICYG